VELGVRGRRCRAASGDSDAVALDDLLWLEESEGDWDPSSCYSTLTGFGFSTLLESLFAVELWLDDLDCDTLWLEDEGDWVVELLSDMDGL